MQRGRAVAGLTLIGLAVLIFTGWSPWSWAPSWPSSDEERYEELDAGMVTAVVLDTGPGDVTIRTGDQIWTSLRTRVDTWSWSDPDTTYRRDGARLVLTGCGRGCAVDYELVVPRGTTVEGHTGSGEVAVVGAAAVDVEAGSGDVVVRGVPGPVDVETGSGEVRLADLAGPAAVDTSSGSVRGSALRGPVTTSTSSGDIVLGLDRAADVRAETSSGDVEVTVPAGRYRVETDEAADVEVVDDPDARHTLELSTSSGDLSVRESES